MTNLDEHRTQLMIEWNEAMRQQHLMPVILLGVDIDDPTNTALMVTEGVDDAMASVVLAELSKRMAREASSQP